MLLDPIAVLETCYARYSSERAWLTELARKLRPLVDAERLSLHAYVARGVDRRIHDVLFFGGYPHDRLESLLSAALAFPPVTADVGRAMVAKLATVRGIASLQALAGDAVAAFWGHGVRDNVAFICADGEGEAIVVAGLATRPRAVDAASEVLWRRVAVHVGAARRLQADDPSLDAEGVESVMAPDGKVLDARGRARPQHERERLREAVRAIDHARTSRGRADPHAALRAWSGLFSGRWSLVDHFDTDGRRFVVARRNDPQSPVVGALTRRQRQVAFYAALGWSNKEIAYCLGLSPSTVSMHLGQALTRLGVRSRIDLVKVATRMAVAAFEAQSGLAPDPQADRAPTAPL